MIRENCALPCSLDLGSAAEKVTLLVLALVLTACVSAPPQDTASTPPSRYELVNDVPDLEPIDLDSISQITPVPEVRTMAGNYSPYTVNGQTYRVLSSEVGYDEIGMASWYGRKFHGHLTSNGEIYDMFQLSAAHKSLPIPSYIRVTNLDNGRDVVVRVNDRGPFHEGRIVDLSYAAAAYLGYADRGTARVRVEAIVPEASRTFAQGTPGGLTRTELAGPDQEEIAAERQRIEAGSGEEFLQVGAFSNRVGAQNLLASLNSITSLPAFIHSEASGDSSTLLHRVRLGPLREGIELQGLIQSIIDAGLGTPFRVRQ